MKEEMKKKREKREGWGKVTRLWLLTALTHLVGCGVAGTGRGRHSNRFQTYLHSIEKILLNFQQQPTGTVLYTKHWVIKTVFQCHCYP